MVVRTRGVGSRKHQNAQKRRTGKEGGVDREIRGAEDRYVRLEAQRINRTKV